MSLELLFADGISEARQAERGLWVDAQPQAPWDWRRQRKQERR